MRSCVVGLLVLGLVGCASGGSGDGDKAVPVYQTTEDVPCEYEVLQTVRVGRTVDLTHHLDSSEIYRILRLELGQAGAAVGADAVISPGSGTAGATRRSSTSQSALGVQARASIRLQGQAVKCIQIP